MIDTVIAMKKYFFMEPTPSLLKEQHQLPPGDHKVQPTEFLASVASSHCSLGAFAAIAMKCGSKPAVISALASGPLYLAIQR
jgi:hypothetical protein